MSISGIGSNSSLYQSLIGMYQSQANSSTYTPVDSTDSDTIKSVDGASASDTSKQQDAQALLRQLQMSSLSLVNLLGSDDSSSESDDLSFLGSDDNTSGLSSLLSSTGSNDLSSLTSLLSSSKASDSNDPFALLLSSLGGQSNGTDLASLLERAYSKTSAYDDADDNTPGQVVNKVN